MEEPISDVRKTWGMGEGEVSTKGFKYQPSTGECLHSVRQWATEGRGVNGDQRWRSISSFVKLDP